MAKDIIFGTDGWRGRSAENHTFVTFCRAARGFANYPLDSGRAKIEAVGGDDMHSYFKGGGGLLIRFSMTESKIRVFTETMHADRALANLEDGLRTAGLN